MAAKEPQRGRGYVGCHVFASCKHARADTCLSSTFGSADMPCMALLQRMQRICDVDLRSTAHGIV